MATKTEQNSHDRVRLKIANERTGGSNPGSLMRVSLEDLKSELESHQKARARIDKANEKLEIEYQNTCDSEDQWEEELDSLERKYKETIMQLEEKLQKEHFAWKQDKKNLEFELSQINTKVEDLENDLDDKEDQAEVEQEKEIASLKEEIARLSKGTDTKKTTIAKLEAQLDAEEELRELAEKETKKLKLDIQSVEESLRKVMKESKKLQTKMDDLKRNERELSRLDDEKDEMKAELERARNNLKKLEKESERIKEEKKVLNDLKNEFEDWESRNEKIEKDQERLKADIKIAKENSEKRGASKDDRLTPKVGRRNDDDMTLSATQRAAVREIEELEDKIRELERVFAQKIGDMEDKIETTNIDQKKFESKTARITEEIEEIKNDVKKIRDHSQKDETEIEEKLAQTDIEYGRLQRELENIRKELVKNQTDIEEVRSQISDQKLILNGVQNNVLKAEFLNSRFEEMEQIFKEEKRQIAEKLISVNGQGDDTEEKLNNTKNELSTLETEYKQFVKDNEALVNKLEEELYADMRKTEELKRLRWKLEQEVTIMRNFFRPKDGERKKVKTDAQADAIIMDRWLDMMRDERTQELRKIREKIKYVKPRDRSLAELQELFHDGLGLLEDVDKEELGYELEDLNKIMVEMGTKAKERFNMLVTIVEEFLDPGIVRELVELLKFQNAPEGLHPLRTAAHILYLSKKDAKADPTVQLRDALLSRLAFERHLRTNKDIETCKTIILEGGEYEDEI